MGNSAFDSPSVRSIIRDADGDTKVEVEKNTDEDIVRVTAGGVEGAKVYSSGIIDLPKQSSARAYRNANQTGVVTSTWTKVQLDTESYDVQSEFDSTTNYRFTTTVDGKYLVVGKIAILDLTDGKRLMAAIRVNNVAVAVGRIDSSISTADPHALVADVVSLTAGDYVELFGWHDKGVNGIFLPAETSTYMAIAKIA